MEDKKLCPRYSAAIFETNKTNLNSATETEKYLTPDDVFLAKAGMKKISKIVDATNIIMLLTSQPLHAFDYDKFVKVGGAETCKISVRAAKLGEKLELIGGKEIDLIESDIVICSNGVPVALAGAMGGAATEIDANTTKIILESATFSLYNERKMQMAHGIFSEAITRFTKGQPAAGTVSALIKCMEKLSVEAKEVSGFADEYEGTESIEIELESSDVDNLLGTKYTPEEMATTLRNVGFLVEVADEQIRVTVPEWRTDVKIKEDVIEEVGRLKGYDNIPKSLPLRPFVGARKNSMFELKRELRSILSDNLSCNEVLTYSFVSKDLQDKVGENYDDSYEIVNSISPELQCFRQSITPSLMDKMYENIRAGHKEFTLYEFNQVTRKSLGLTDERVPEMQNHLAVLSTEDFYFAKMMLMELGRKLKIDFRLEENTLEELPYFEKVRSAKVTLAGETVGVVGEIKVRVLKKFKIKQAAGLELNLDKIVKVKRAVALKLKISKFPYVERDLTVKVKDEFKYGLLEAKITKVFEMMDKIIFEVVPVSIYQGEDKTSKNVSFHLSFANTEKTLEAEEISAIMNRIEQKMSELGAEIV